MAATKGRTLQPLSLSQEQREQLQAIVASRTRGHGLVRRAQIVLLSAQGLSNSEVARRMRLSHPTVSLWRERFRLAGMEGLTDLPRPGAPRTLEDERIAVLIDKTLQSTPAGQTHWSCRTMAQATGISKTSVQRIWSTFALQPHRQDTFRLSNDPLFVEKVRDLVGLYLAPPLKALVLAVDEKSQIQALERAQPMLPLSSGHPESACHEYARHGTTTLFAAFDAGSGHVITQCRSRHRHQEFLSFLRHIDKNVPAEIDVHLIMDNYATHKHQKVKAWLARHPRYHVHFTPTYASWLNLVERWFALLSQRAILRGSFRSVKELIKCIQDFIANYNRSAKPFAWVATADSILEKIGRYCEAISGTEH